MRWSVWTRPEGAQDKLRKVPRAHFNPTVGRLSNKHTGFTQPVLEAGLRVRDGKGRNPMKRKTAAGRRRCDSHDGTVPRPGRR